jgi:hypothetical protein
VVDGDALVSLGHPVQIEPTDITHITAFMIASAAVLALVILIVDSVGRQNRPNVLRAFATAAAISVVGILFGKFGANWGFSWVVYYTIPALATIFLPPLIFRWSWARGAIYMALAFATAPLIHAAFFYTLGWAEYLPFLSLPPL